MTAFSDAEITALESGAAQYGITVRLATDDPVLLWSGAGQIFLGGETYHGAGELLQVPSFSQVINGAAEEIVVGLSGVSPAVIALAASSAADVKDRELTIGIVIFDRNWAPLGPVRWQCSFAVDAIILEQQPQPDPSQPIKRTVSLNCSSDFSTRLSRKFSFLTNGDQQERSPGDLFCDRTGINQVWTKAWGPIAASSTGIFG